MMKPEPSELTRRGAAVAALSSPPWPRRFLKNSSKNSSNGEPGGSCGIGCSLRASTVCEVEMLTTASITFSATSAMLSGPRASAGVRQRRQARARPRAIAAKRRRRTMRADGRECAAMAVNSPGKAIECEQCSRPRRTQGPIAASIQLRFGRTAIRAETRLARHRSAAHQPDQQRRRRPPSRCRSMRSDASGVSMHARHRPLRRPGKGGEQQPLDRRTPGRARPGSRTSAATDRVRDCRATAPAYRAGAARRRSALPGLRGAVSRGLPDGSPK